MSLRIIGSFRLTRRVAIATALAASLGLTTQAAADERVTALLRGGERVTGRFDGFANGLVHIDVSDTDERKIPVGDVALIDLVGAAQGLPETELREARGDDHLLLLKSGLVLWETWDLQWPEQAKLAFNLVVALPLSWVAAALLFDPIDRFFVKHAARWLSRRAATRVLNLRSPA